jgi:peptidoglycan hydrolase CwlO-like protein
MSRATGSAPNGRRGLRSVRSICSFALALIAVSVCSLPSAGADTASDLRKAQSDLSTLLARVDAATKQRDALQSQLITLLERVDAGRRSIEATQGRIVDAQLATRQLAQAVAAHQHAIDAMARQAYMTGPAGGLAIVLESTSFGDMAERVADLNAGTGQISADTAELDAARKQLVDVEGGLEHLYAKRHSVQTRMESDASSLAVAFQQQQAVVAQLDSDRTKLQSTLKVLRDRRERELAEEALRHSGHGNYKPPSTPPGQQKKVVALIHYYFGPLGQGNLETALCVGWRESRYIPTAVNKYSGAAGVYQFMPNLWPWFSSNAGWKGADVFDPVANVAVAAYTVAHYGWSPWHSDSGYCNT